MQPQQEVVAKFQVQPMHLSIITCVATSWYNLHNHVQWSRLSSVPYPSHDIFSSTTTGPKSHVKRDMFYAQCFQPMGGGRGGLGVILAHKGVKML